MVNEKIVVSFCMIGKDEEANLKMCLDSILPILHEPWAELVFVDTGSTDRTEEIARMYTDKVYRKEFIPWHFSNARNYAISHAEGRFIMTIDCDHMLPQQFLYQLEDLLLSMIEREEKTTFLMVRNYVDPDNVLYTEMLQPLIFQNDGEPIYEFSVHNKPRCQAPFIFANHIFLHHFGYKFHGSEKNEARKQNIKERSLPLLIEEYEKDPDNLHILTHLCKMYYVFNEFDNTIKYSNIWMEQMRKIEFHEGWFSYLEVFVNLVSVYLSRDDVDNAIEVMEEAEKYSDRLLGIYSGLAAWLANHDKEFLAEKYYMKCLDIAKTEGSPYEMLITNWNVMAVPGIMQWLALYHFRKGDYKIAGDFVNEGIRINENRVKIRWDIWNEKSANKRLKHSIVKKWYQKIFS